MHPRRLWPGRTNDTVSSGKRRRSSTSRVVRKVPYRVQVRQTGLEKSDAFKMTKTLIDLGSLVKTPSRLLDIPRDVLDAFTGAPNDTIDEQTADDLSVLIEGRPARARTSSPTTRPGAILSSLQNFRYGQFNFQSSVQQATLNGRSTCSSKPASAGSTFPIWPPSQRARWCGGGVGSSSDPSAPRWELIGGGIRCGHRQQRGAAGHDLLLPGHDDGPDWWSGTGRCRGCCSTAARRSMLSEFSDIQDFLARDRLACVVPSRWFDRVVERRTSAYDDANFPLLDIGHIGPKGFWLFGKVVHPVAGREPTGAEESYVGVFSNKRPEWLSMESDPYDHYVEERRDKDEEDDGGNRDV